LIVAALNTGARARENAETIRLDFGDFRAAATAVYLTEFLRIGTGGVYAHRRAE